MVGLAARASNNHINGAVWGYNIDKNVHEGEQKLHRYYRKDFGLLTVQLFSLMIDTEGVKTRGD